MKYKRNKSKYKPPYRHWTVDYNLLRQGFEAKFVGNKAALHALAGIGASYSRLLTLDTDVVAPRVLCTGSVSSGKTSAVREFAKLLNVPIVTISAGELSPSGYRGVNLSSGLRTLVNQAGSKEQIEQYGSILHIDEIDKWALTKSNDNFYENIIYNTFSIMGGETTQVDADEYGNDGYQINTQKIMVILTGAFSWISENYFRDSDKAIKKINQLGYPTEFCSRINAQIHFEKLKPIEFQEIIRKKSELLSECYRAGRFTPTLCKKDLKTITQKVIKNKLGIRSSHRFIAENYYNQTARLKELTI